MKLRWFAAALALWLALATAATAAVRPAVNVWGTGDGLPQSSVISMVQTRDSYLWLGTLNGLSRFDGQHFTTFDESNTPGLNDSRILNLFEDSQARLWIGTETAGPALMKDGRILALGQGELSGGGAERRLVAICESADGAVWLYTANGDLWRYQRQQLTRFFLPAALAATPRSIIQETNGPLWVATSRGQYALGPIQENGAGELPVAKQLPAGRLDWLVASKSGGFWRLADNQVQKWNSNRLERAPVPYPWLSVKTGVAIGTAIEDQSGRLVVGTLYAGVFQIDSSNRVTSLSTNDDLSNNYVFSLVADNQGALWVGTDGGGFNRVRPKQIEKLSETPDWVVQSVCGDEQGGLWIASNGNGLGYWKDGTLQPVEFDSALARIFGPFVKSVFVDRTGRVWAGTSKIGLFRKDEGRFQQVNGDGLLGFEVPVIHQDRAGTLWFGTPGGLVSWNEREWKRTTARDGLTSDNITALASGANGDLWIGTRRDGLSRRRDGKFTAYHKSDGLPSDAISALWMDAQGVLWVGTFGSGLARFENGTWTRYSTREGLISNNLGYIVEDGDGNLWLGSNAGVLRVPKKALNDFAHGLVSSVPCRAFGKADGLPILECSTGSQPGAWRGRDGRLWFPTIKGLASVDPRQIRPNTNPPPVTIESVLIDYEPVTKQITVGPSGLPTVTVSPGAEQLKIYYASVNLGAPDRTRYRHWLEGYEKNWNEAANDTRSVPYLKLPPGQYTFHVTACNEDDVWNETGASLTVIVERPYWKTWWFLGALLLGVAGLGAGVVHYLSTQKLQRQLAVMRQQEALEKERARIARDIHDQVGASLTQVALLGELVESDKDSPSEIEAHARQISQTARETTRALDEIVWTVNPQNDTLEGLVNYICKNAQDYLAVAGVRYRFDLPAQLPAQAVAPDVRHNVFLASKEAVTNVVRHAKADAAWLRMRLEPNSLVVEIEDNGRGLGGLDPEAAMRRNGLKNMRKRMEDIGGTFTIGPGGEGGALVRLTVPLEMKSE